MAIKKYIPLQTAIRDNRSKDGGYYEAVCDNEDCKREYYPKTSSSKYCSSVCAVREHRKRNGTLFVENSPPKKFATVSEKDKTLLAVEQAKEIDAIENDPATKTPADQIRPRTGMMFIGRASCFEHLQDHLDISVRGLKKALKDVAQGDGFTWGNAKVKRMSQNKYQVYWSAKTIE